MRKFSVLVVAVVTAASVMLTGCNQTNNTNDSAKPAGGTFNAADVEFAQSMIPHHQQAVMMSTMVQARSSNPNVKNLAADIKAAQQPEIDLMRSWLTEWEVAELDPAGHMAMGHGTGGTNMPGMMSASALNSLSRASGRTFDDMFLSMMIDHHEGAIDMARTVKSEGSHSEVAVMATAIIKAQAAEIVTMKRLLNA